MDRLSGLGVLLELSPLRGTLGDAMKVAILMNASAGSIGKEKSQEREQMIREVFAKANMEVDLFTCEPSCLRETAKSAAESGVDAVVAAGGDGTLSVVASALVGSNIPLGVLPLGTLNHFAQDAGIPLNIEEAAKIIAAQQVAHIDVGEVNGRFFINNSSIGLYPEIVIGRDIERKQHGTKKWRAMWIAARRVLKRFPLLLVRIVTPNRSLNATTPFVFIGNNEYQSNALDLGKRLQLDEGLLSLYLIRCKGRLKMFWLMVRAILQRLDAVRDFEAERVTEAHVFLGKGRKLRVALDGEVFEMASPLHYKIHPKALAVLR